MKDLQKKKNEHGSKTNTGRKNQWAGRVQLKQMIGFVVKRVCLGKRRNRLCYGGTKKNEHGNTKSMGRACPASECQRICLGKPCECMTNLAKRKEKGRLIPAAAVFALLDASSGRVATQRFGAGLPLCAHRVCCCECMI